MRGVMKAAQRADVRVGGKVWRKAGLWGSWELRLDASWAKKRVGTRAEKRAAMWAWASGSWRNLLALAKMSLV